MTVFFILCVVLVGVALALLLPPLIRQRGSVSPAAFAGADDRMASNAAIYKERLAELDAELRAGTIDQAQWSSARSEIERRAVDEAADPAPSSAGRSSPYTAAAIGAVIPVVAAILYLYLGSIQALLPESGSSREHTVTPEQINAMVTRLAERMKTNPADTEGWILLAHSYGALGKYDDAVAAFAQAARQRPQDAQLLADYADTLAMSRGRRLDGEPEALIARALKVDGNNIKALALAGTVAYERQDFRGAIAHWQNILRQLPQDSADAESIRGIIKEAGERISPQTSAVAKAGADAAPAKRASAESNAPRLQGKVSLAASAAGKTKPEDTVFVYARAAEGPRMPLAILRRQVKDLPFEFALDDSMAMDPSRKLSAFDKVVVVVRVSKSGSAAAQKGDLEAVSAPVSPNAKGLRIEVAKAVE